MFRLQSPVIWRQASCYMFEDILQPQSVNVLYQLGPNYLGSFQSINLDSSESNTSTLITEEKIMFGLHAQKAFEMTLAKFKKVYNKNDSKSIGKQLNISSNESVTPIRILSNTATQLNGAARSVGGVIIGYLGVRTFEPSPVSQTIEHVGGVSFLLCLIAMSNDIEFMYASVKALVCIIKSNSEIAKEMERINGYQLLAMIYKRKKHLINSHILNLTFSLVIADDSGKEQAVVSNTKAFEYLLCDLEIWYDTPAEIQRSLHERFNDLLNDQLVNTRLFQRLNMLKRFLFMIKEPNPLNDTTLKCCLTTVKLLISDHMTSDDLLKFGQYLVSLLPDVNINEKTVALEQATHLNHSSFRKNNSNENVFYVDSPAAPSGSFNFSYSLAYTIKLRNRLLSIVDDIISQQTNSKSLNFQEELQKLLGYDWFLLFMQPHVHKTTLIKSCKMLFTLLLNSQNLFRFKESTYCGGWLNNVFSQIVSNKSDLNYTNTPPTSANLFTSSTKSAFNYNSSFSSLQTTATTTTSDALNTSSSSAMLTSQLSVNSEMMMNMEICTAPCFQLIQVYFSKSVDTVELYYLLFALLFDAQKIKELPADADLDLNSICKYVFDKSFDSEHTLFSKINTDVSLDITIILLSMIRTLMNFESAENELATKSKDYAIILLQIFRFMYHNCDEFKQSAANSDFLSALILTLYPYSEMCAQDLAAPPASEIKPFAEAICSSTSTNKSVYKSYLSIHPARKLVMDFLRDLIYDGIVNNTITNKGIPLIDLILVSLPDYGSSCLKRNQEFITELFKTIIDYLVTIDLFNDQQQITTQLSVSISLVLQNFFNLIERLVDKLWDGMYRRESREVFDLIVKFINNLKKKPLNYSNEQLVIAMNRTLLYQLSRPCVSLGEQVAMLEVLHKMTSLKSLIFAQTNVQQSEFFACVTHCLLSITDDEPSSCYANFFEEKSMNSKTQWYTSPYFSGSAQASLIMDEKLDANNAKNLLLAAAQRVWLDLYLSKKSNLEDCLKVSLNSIGKNIYF